MYRIIVKYMACSRCITAVEKELKKINIPFSRITLGEIIMEEQINEVQRDILRKSLAALGFELLENKNSRIVSSVKHFIRYHVSTLQDNENQISKFSKSELDISPAQLASLFLKHEGISLHKYYSQLRIEKVQELLIEQSLTLTEIAHLMNYSSVAHLSSQFKKTTGIKPSAYLK